MVSIPVTSLPVGTGAIKVTIQRLNGTGTVWVDDVRCEEGVSRKEDKSYYYHTDYLGSPRVMTDPLGNVIWRQDYYAFGSDYNTSATGNTHKFTGHVKDDATGQYYAKARYFTTGLGRFSQPEPLLKGVPEGSFLANPHSLNPYVYCVNNPLKLVDKTGLFFEKIFNNKEQQQKVNPKYPPRSANEFLNAIGDKNINDLTFEAGGKFQSSGGGPNYKYRFVTDPFDNTTIIDMRHFLVVGDLGELVGLGIEVIQYVADKSSAFDAQDFYSNALGVEFYSNYYNKLSGQMSLQQILAKYFNDRKDRGEKERDNDKNVKKKPGGIKYYDMLRDNYHAR